MVTALRGPDWGSPLSAVAPLLHDPVVLPGCGQWTQQEHPAEVNATLLDFLARLDDSTSSAS
jgi:pimeloyl-ACP methyl ester carboxylesterase